MDGRDFRVIVHDCAADASRDGSDFTIRSPRFLSRYSSRLHPPGCEPSGLRGGVWCYEPVFDGRASAAASAILAILTKGGEVRREVNLTNHSLP